MAWLSPALAIADVQKRFAIVSTNAVPAEVVTNAIDDAENLLRPFVEKIWGTTATTNGTVRMLTIQESVALVFRSAWGAKAFGAEAAIVAAEGIDEWVFEKLKMLAEDGVLTGASTEASGVTNATDTSPIFSLGKPETWPEPSDAIETDVTERRTF